MMTWRQYGPGLCLAVLLGAAACSEKNPSAPAADPLLADLRIAAGNNQKAAVGTPLARPLAVEALDQYGQALAGVEVLFEVEVGAGLLDSAAVRTDAAGLAAVRYTLGAGAGVQQVSARAAGLNGLPPRFTLVAEGAAIGQEEAKDGPAPLVDAADGFFRQGEPANIVLLDTDPPAIGVRGAGTNQTAVATFEVRDLRGNPVRDGIAVHFSLDSPGGGDETVDPPRAETLGGRVRVAIGSGTLARTVRLVAEVFTAADTVRSTPVPIAIHGGLPDRGHFSLAAHPVNLAGRVLFGLQSTITAYVFDAYSNPVAPGTSVRFRTDGGGVQGATEADVDGQGAVQLFTAAPIPQGPGFLATVTGQTVDAQGQQIEASTTVLFSGPTAPIRLFDEAAAAGDLFIADGGFRIIAFSVSDISGHPLMGGSVIEVSSDVARVGGDARVVIPDTRSGHTEFAVVLSDPAPDEDPPQEPQRGSVLIKVRSPNGDQQLSFGLNVD
jgi:hypothetical protein